MSLTVDLREGGAEAEVAAAVGENPSVTSNVVAAEGGAGVGVVAAKVERSCLATPKTKDLFDLVAVAAVESCCCFWGRFPSWFSRMTWLNPRLDSEMSFSATLAADTWLFDS